MAQYVSFDTSMGSLTFELYVNEAPKTVSAFAPVVAVTDATHGTMVLYRSAKTFTNWRSGVTTTGSSSTA